MILVYPKLNLSFEMKMDKLNAIIIEEPGRYETFLMDLFEQIHKKTETFNLYAHDEKKELHKQAELISSPMELSFVRKDLQKRLHSYLAEEAALTEITACLSQKYGEIIALMDDLNFQSDYPLEYSLEVELADILKHLDVHIKQPEGRFVEKLLDYGSSINRLLDKNIFIVANCESFLAEKDYEYLEKWAEYQEIYLLLVNHRQVPLNMDLNEVIIDRDLCELR